MKKKKTRDVCETKSISYVWVRVREVVSMTVYRLPIRLPAKSALTWPVV